MNESMKLKIIFTLIVTIGISSLLNGQTLTQTIKGFIVDEESQVSLPGATIIILDKDPIIGTITDFEGLYKIENVPLGRYNIQVSYLGYESIVFQEILVSSGKEMVLNVGLKESVVKMDEVVIKAKSNKDEPLNTMSTVSARRISVEEARRYAGGFDDPARLVSSFAGVTGNLSSNGIVVRGNAPKGILWRMEGVEISNPNHFADVTTFGAGGITALSSQMLANSDFFTGAFPAEYGNALSGVFDIKLRNGNNENREHTFQLGAIGIDFSSEGPFVKGKRSSYLFNYRYSTFSLIAGLLPENAGRIRYQDLSFKLNFPTKKAGVFSLWGLGAKDISGQYAEEDSTLWEFATDREDILADQYTVAIGATHKIIIGKKSYINTSLAASGNGLEWNLERLDNNLSFTQGEIVNNSTWKYTISSFLNHKFNAKHTNRTGLILNRLAYNINIMHAEQIGGTLINIVDEVGNSGLFQAFTQSKLNISPKFTINIGAYFQYFVLNKNYSFEPRAGMKWKLIPGHALSIGYGRHSQLEMLGIYLAQHQTASETRKINKKLDFSKADHIVLGYDLNINKNIRLKIEPYYQFLHNIPVIIDSSFSILNLENDWFINDSLVNKGEGVNYGVDITLERFLKNGYYYLVTASIFDSKYKGGDGIERNSRFNKGYVASVLGGKEWEIGRKGKNNFLGINGRINFVGGDRISPVNETASLLAREIIYDENRAFENKKPNIYYLDLSITFRVNKQKHASVWALQLINILGAMEFYGYKYNHKTNSIVKDKELTMVPNISYKIEF